MSRRDGVPPDVVAARDAGTSTGGAGWLLQDAIGPTDLREINSSSPTARTRWDTHGHHLMTVTSRRAMVVAGLSGVAEGW